MDPERLFKRYETVEGEPFHRTDRAVGFPQEPGCGLYSRLWCGRDEPWTVLSYRLYGTTERWYDLACINAAIYGREAGGWFYAPAGRYVYYVPRTRLAEVDAAVSRSL